MADELYPKDYRTIIYNKNEIDTINSEESLRVNNELNKKVDKLNVGMPSGVASLDVNGKVGTSELPIATNIEIDDIDNDKTLITPRGFTYAMQSRGIPDMPVVDGSYKLVITDGIATWELI